MPMPDDLPVTSLVTLQFSLGGLFDAEPTDNLIHLVRRTSQGTPGPTLCGINRFGPDAPGWSVGGGVSGPGIILTPCQGCAQTARADYSGLPVNGSVGGREMANHLEVTYAR
jgi:hypothetical protein